ncbi:hypothetical protein NGH39_12885 [Staphylococcus pasteuri]|nr:hypothetical protein [Staphylococcus pasteuri]MCO0862717.1 hypothetical protein [Staphylococcus pasteuri]
MRDDNTARIKPVNADNAVILKHVNHDNTAIFNFVIDAQAGIRTPDTVGNYGK